MKNLPIFELFDLWMLYKSTHVCETTINEYYGCIQARLKKFFLHDQVIERSDALKFMGWLQKQNLAPETRRRTLETLSSCYLWGIEESFVSHNPWRNLSKLIKVSKPDIQPFTVDEVKKIVRGFDEEYPEYVSFVKFLLLTGCRIGEATGLRWTDVVDYQRITFASQLTRKGERKPVKNGKPRTFCLNVDTQVLLKNLHRSQYQDLVFTVKGKFVHSNSLLQRWEKVLDHQKVFYRCPYNCRHTFVSHCIHQGMNPLQIASVTGHDPFVLFTHYAGLFEQPQVPELYGSCIA